MEHYLTKVTVTLWSMICYGSDNNANGPAEGHGVLVNKYLKKLNDGSHPGIANVIYDAFKLAELH